MRTITFTAGNRQALAHDRYYHPDPRVQRKMDVLWLKSHGLSHDQIATSADVSRSTVQRYLDQYLEGGLPHLRQCHWHQPQGALADHKDSLEEYFSKHPVRSAKQAQRLQRQADMVRRVGAIQDPLGPLWVQSGAPLRVSGRYRTAPCRPCLAVMRTHPASHSHARPRQAIPGVAPPRCLTSPQPLV